MSGDRWCRAASTSDGLKPRTISARARGSSVVVTEGRCYRGALTVDPPSPVSRGDVRGSGEAFAEVVAHVRHRDPHLLHRVTLADRHGMVVERVEVVGDAEGRA